MTEREQGRLNTILQEMQNVATIAFAAPVAEKGIFFGKRCDILDLVKKMVFDAVHKKTSEEEFRQCLANLAQYDYSRPFNQPCAEYARF